MKSSSTSQFSLLTVRCNSVHPGPIDTDTIRETLTDPARLEERMKRLPMGRVGTAEEIAYGVLYLASDEASFVTGSELVIDAGPPRNR